jgi:uncharacterized short protein YbdD (DUF466 family)
MTKSSLEVASVFWIRAVQTARLMVGVPDYDTYLAHVREKHPERTPMTHAEFFKAAQKARFDGRPGRCC